MRLKEIKPGMAVHCKSIDEKKALYDELCRIGNMKTDSYTDSFDNFKDSNCNYKICDLKRETWCFTTEPATVEFSDLILPDLTNEEVLQICGEICEAYSNKGYNCKTTCPFGFHGMSCTVYRSQNFDKTIEICQRWKFDHKKNEPEIETVDICRIIEIQPGGCKRCVHEEDMDIDRDLPFEDENAEIRRILKAYCMEHDGEYIAVHEVVSRVKAVE